MCKRDIAFLQSLENVNLTPLQHSVLEKRYIQLVQEFQRRCFILAILFHSSRTIVTVGSLVVPALLSIQYTDASPASATYSTSYQIYWITWVISLLVTTCNGLQTIFKLEKKYYFLHTTMEHLQSEGWQYLQLSGRYSGFFTPSEVPSHENQFIFFCSSIEKIKMKQVEEEYWKVNENQQAAASQDPKTVQQKKPLEQLIPPTPLRPLSGGKQTLVTILEQPEQTKNELVEKEEPEEKKPEPTIVEIPIRNERAQTSEQKEETRGAMSV